MPIWQRRKVMGAALAGTEACLAPLGLLGSVGASPHARAAPPTEPRGVPAGSTGDTSASEASYDTPGHVWRPWPAGRARPALALPSLDGAMWRLQDAAVRANGTSGGGGGGGGGGGSDDRGRRGQPLLLNFWATWCGPCIEELPSLARLAASFGADGPRIVCINHKEAAEPVRRFLAALPGPAAGLPGTVQLLDASGNAFSTWTPRILPTTVLIDRRGRPLGSVIGAIDWDGPAARALLAPLLRG